MVFSAKVFFSKVVAGSGKSEPYPQIKNGSLHSILRVGNLGKVSEDVGLSAHTTIPRRSEDGFYNKAYSTCFALWKDLGVL